MSNDCNRDAGRSTSPADLQASDFFPPGEGWNKDSEDAPSVPQKRDARECNDDEFAVDGGHPR